MAEAFFDRYKANLQFEPAPGSLRLKAIDMHTGGEPLRVITEGYPDIKATSLLDYRQRLRRDHDHLRQALMYEPRGHADMYGCLLLPPFDERADCSVIFMHNEGYSTMCGHAVIAIMTLAMQMGWVHVNEGRASMNIEAPCGLIRAKGETVDGQIRASFECVASFVTAQNQSIWIESLGKTIQYDIAYGGAFYAYVDADSLDIELTAQNSQKLSSLGREIKLAVASQSEHINHPFEPDLSELYGTIFVGKSHSPSADSRNVCVFADGEVDRSPTGSGVSGRMSLHYAKGEIGLGQSMVIESIIGSCFTGQVSRPCRFGPFEAVIPEVSGQAHVCGQHEFIIQPQDPLRHGFLLR